MGNTTQNDGVPSSAPDSSTSSKYAAAFTYSDQELLDLYRQAMAAVTIKGQSYEVAGRKWTAADLLELRNTVAYYERRVNASSYGLIQNQIVLRRR